MINGGGVVETKGAAVFQSSNYPHQTPIYLHSGTELTLLP